MSHSHDEGKHVASQPHTPPPDDSAPRTTGRRSRLRLIYAPESAIRSDGVERDDARIDGSSGAGPTSTRPLDRKSASKGSSVRQPTSRDAKQRSGDGSSQATESRKPNGQKSTTSSKTQQAVDISALSPTIVRDAPPKSAEQHSDQVAKTSAKPRKVKLRVLRRKRRPRPWLQEVLKSEETRRRGCFGWGTAAYLHAIVLLVLSGFFLYSPQKDPPIILSATFADLDREVPDSVVVIPEETPEVEPVEQPPELEPVPEPEPQPEAQAAPPPPAFEPIAAAEASEPAEVSASTADAVAESTTSSDSGNNPNSEPVVDEAKLLAAEHAKIRMPPHSVTSGNFTAWTEPPFPLPGQPYRIIILVRLPLKITEYPSSDLTGVVVGSDGYQKIIRGSPYEMLPLDHHTARLEIPVVGSERGFKDTIMVQSKILRERRVIELIYPRFRAGR